MCTNGGKYYKANGVGNEIGVCVDSQRVLTFLCALVSSEAGRRDRIFGQGRHYLPEPYKL